VTANPEIEVPVELDDEGLSTGVELLRADGHIDEPFDPAKIDVVTRTMTVDLLLARLRRGVLDLAPDFQRLAGIWNEVNQSKLIESLLLRIPLPTFYAAEVGEESWAIVDGIQRLTTIARFVDPISINAVPLRLRGLEYLGRYKDCTYQDLPGALRTRIDETELIVHLIRSGTPESVMYNIFARLNTGGRPLTNQELRHALIPGRSRTLLRELAESREFLDATQRSVKPTRMADREMVLRFLAFRLTDPRDYPGRGDLDAFLRDTMRTINNLPPSRIASMTPDFARAMRAAKDVFGTHAFRKRYPGQSGRLPVNKALFEAESVGLANMSDLQLAVLRGRRDLVEIGFMDLMRDINFQEAISAATGDPHKVRIRFSSIEQLLREVAN
jgi:hypothetical protein